MENKREEKFALLLVDDESRIRSALKRLFFKEAYQLYEAGNGEDALDLLSRVRIHAALIDLKMPGMDGLSLLKRIKEARPDTMVIMLTGHGSIEDAVEAIRNGAEDFIEKPFISESLMARIHQLYKIWQLERENRLLKSEMGLRFKYEKLVGNSPGTLRLKQLISQVAPSETTVLIEGETGTGKELVAKAIHYHSPRAKGAFVVVDCTTINQSMMESELFGHKKGAFTGAYDDTPGLIRAADHGTLFFDEIGELPMGLQAKLLRVIQEKEIRPVGESRSKKVDIRILAATNRDLKTEIGAGRFREDLYYRLNAVRIEVSALRNRIEDIPLLVSYFINRLTTDFSTITGISKQALMLMEGYGWPGNIRELENLVRRVMALSQGRDILPSDLPDKMTGRVSGQVTPSEDSLAAWEKAAIESALRKCGDHRKNAARLLKIGEATLYRKLKRYGK